jgi:hypothetical protein
VTLADTGHFLVRSRDLHQGHVLVVSAMCSSRGGGAGCEDLAYVGAIGVALAPLNRTEGGRARARWVSAELFEWEGSGVAELFVWSGGLE